MDESRDGSRAQAVRALRDPREYGLASAWEEIQRRLKPTPLVYEPALSACLGRPIHLKLESLQQTGSFKVRGAVVAVSRLTAAQREAGVVACSSGNHGKAVAWAAREAGVAAVICVPSWVDPVKRIAMEEMGADVRLVADSYDAAEAEAVRLQQVESLHFIHPFDDPAVIAGQATTAFEVLDACPDVEDLLVCLSGGGLAGGMAYALKAAGSNAKVTGVSASAARVMLASQEAGRPLELPEEPTLATALAGGIGLENRYSFDLVRETIPRHQEVSEEQLAQAMGYAFRQLGLIVEGGGAAALASLLYQPLPLGDGPLVAVVSGGNVSTETMSRVLAETA